VKDFELKYEAYDKKPKGYNVNPLLNETVVHQDDRLGPGVAVFGAANGGESAAWTLETIRTRKRIETSLGGAPLTIRWDNSLQAPMLEGTFAGISMRSYLVRLVRVLPRNAAGNSARFRQGQEAMNQARPRSPKRPRSLALLPQTCPGRALSTDSSTRIGTLQQERGTTRIKPLIVCIVAVGAVVAASALYIPRMYLERRIRRVAADERSIALAIEAVHVDDCGDSNPDAGKLHPGQVDHAGGLPKVVAQDPFSKTGEPYRFLNQRFRNNATYYVLASCGPDGVWDIDRLPHRKGLPPIRPPKEAKSAVLLNSSETSETKVRTSVTIGCRNWSHTPRPMA